MGIYNRNRYSKMRSILIIQPNSTTSMTEALKPLVDSLNFTETSFTYFTAPSGPRSINDEADALESAHHCLPLLLPLLTQHSGFLIACYSQHPLVPLLKAQPAIRDNNVPVTGIFEASAATSLQLVRPEEKFGIVSTGKVWEDILSEAVQKFLGTSEEETSKRFAGVETTGLNATDLHDAPQEEVERRMKEAVKRLLKKGSVGAICLGCAGMAGMDRWVREACVEELGKEEGGRVRVVDGVVAGVAWLEGVCRMGF
ncbi:hydantoin racemase-like protein [Dendryphion nanum]|uniref:Hydantoin racemase-like protein n=1 Tax=Dendryphion nanum TaxID=256645 RepID=A0A9P9D705_9PLEO|nr:hydantoin racemase-like protein [Dendryphion nanum]